MVTNLADAAGQDLQPIPGTVAPLVPVPWLGTWCKLLERCERCEARLESRGFRLPKRPSEPWSSCHVVLQLL